MTTGIISDNRAPNDGGIYIGNYATHLSGGIISNNTAVNDGDGIYVKYPESLQIFDEMVFSDNQASTAYNQNPIDDEIYHTKIDKNVTWTTPFTQGYNNYDSSYTNGEPLSLKEAE
jgi:hypothetical protein